MRRVAAALCLLGAAVLVPAGAGGPTAVTLSVQRFYSDLGIPQFFFTGAVSSGRSGEYVAVMRKRCGAPFATAVAGATTDERGRFAMSPSLPLGAGTGTYRARWKNEFSESLTLRPPIEVRAKRLRRGKVRVTVRTYELTDDLTGRAVVLERLDAGKWSPIQHAQLAEDPREDLWVSYVATFTYRERGVSLRAVVPAATAGKCFKRGATKKWKA
jgi:hypothetical protein